MCWFIVCCTTWAPQRSLSSAIFTASHDYNSMLQQVAALPTKTVCVF